MDRSGGAVAGRKWNSTALGRLPRPLGRLFVAVFVIATGLILAAPGAGAAAPVTLYTNMSSPVQASGVNEQPVGNYGPGNDFTIAKQFVPTTSGTGNLVSVWSQCSGIPCSGTGTLQITTNNPVNGGQPSSTVLGTMTFSDSDSLGTSPSCSAMSPGAALTAGQSYWAVMSSSDEIAWNDQNDTPDTVLQSLDGGTTWTIAPDAKELSLTVQQGVGCQPQAEPNPTAGTTVGNMYTRSGHQVFNTITISNGGVSALDLESASFTGAGASVFSLLNAQPGPLAQPFAFPSELGLNMLDILYVTCTAPAAEGDYQATLTLTTNDPNNPTISWPVDCVVVDTPPTISFFASPPNGQNGWYVTTPVEVDVNATPAVQGDLITDLCGIEDSAASFNLTGQGPNTITCAASDIAGNVSAPASYTVDIDSRPPVITGTISPPPNAAGWNNTALTFSFSCADPTPGSGIATDTVGGNGSVSAGTSGESNVTSTGTCSDKAGNVATPATLTIKVDQTPPTTSITSAPPTVTNQTTDSVSFTGTDNLSGVASFLCSLDGAPSTPCTSPYTAAGLTDGTHNLAVAAVDFAGNVDPTPATATWTVDTVPPTVVFDSPAPGSDNPSSGSITFHATDPESNTYPPGSTYSFTCSLDGATATLCTSPYSYSELVGGSHTLAVTATDPAGNQSATQTLQFNVLQAPSITSAASTTFTVGTQSSFPVTASGFPAATFTETGALPTGVTLDPTTGLLSGTPAAGTGGTYPITITATNEVGTATQQFTLTVNEGPAITSAASTTFTVGTQSSFPVTASGFPAATFTETGALPTGVTLDPTTGLLSGTPAAGTGGTYPITITATNGIGSAATQQFTLTVDQAPAITSASSATFTAGTLSNFTLSATGFPDPAFGASGALPSGMSLVDNGNGTATLSGTPAAGTGGIYHLSITASNGVGTDASQAFTLTVEEAPTITSASSTTFTVGTQSSFPVTASGFPAATFTETGALPTDVTLDPTTGLLSGTPAAGTGGTYPITITATNGIGSAATQQFSLTVDQALVITSASSATFTAGTLGSFDVTASGFPAATFTETGALPTGVTLDPTTGLLSGTPAAGTGGTYPITITATNGVSSDVSQGFLVTVDEAPAISSALSTTFTAGTAGSFTVTTAGFPVPTLTDTGVLPSGVTFADNGDGTATLSGTASPGSGGKYAITITAANGIGGESQQSFTLTVNEAPAITSATSFSFTTGSPGSFTVTSLGFPAPTFSETGTLPSGVNLTSAGVLSGQTSSTGAYPITITASNGIGSDATQSFTLIIGEVPTITSATSATFTVGTLGTFKFTSSGFPAPTFTESGGLPSGVTFTDNGNGTATLSGTPAAGTGRVYPITIDVQNGVSDPTQAFSLTVDQPAAITIAGSGTLKIGVDGSVMITATGFPAPTLNEAGTLPAGITFDPASGELGGTPAAGTAGVYHLTFTAHNGVGANAKRSFTLTVAAPATSPTASASGVPASGAVLASEPATLGSESPELSPTSSSLPETGANLYLPVLGALIAITAGLALALGARRRRREPGTDSEAG